MKRANKPEHRKQRAFLAAYRSVGLIAPACRKANCSRTQIYEWIKDKDFKAQMDAAREEACDTLESEAMRRAVSGYEIPVFHKGQQVGTTRRFSDGLLMFLLKAARPYRYRDQPSPNFRSIAARRHDEESI